MMADKGMLIILSGPSGVGKDTVLDNLDKNNSNSTVSISLTTREKREYEVDGENYYFVDRAYFEKVLNEDGLIEYCEYNGCYYGTPKDPLDAMLARGTNVILKIEVQGAAKVRALYPDCVSIFILPPSLKVLENRLRSRASDDEENIQHRLLIAKEEIKRSTEYDYIVINNQIEKAAEDVLKIINAESYKTSRNKNTIREVINNE